MATGPERSKPLHNFSLPCLKWRTQRLLRCVNANLDCRSSRFDALQNGVVRVPNKRKMNDSDVVFLGGLGEEASSVANHAMMPWNLRTRETPTKLSGGVAATRGLVSNGSSDEPDRSGPQWRLHRCCGVEKEERNPNFWKKRKGNSDGSPCRNTRCQRRRPCLMQLQRRPCLMQLRRRLWQRRMMGGTAVRAQRGEARVLL
ncbi:hypothetical protein LR48_Vigan03g071300 [Vigna angularis]|uniref:Uncharacterized protein n=1 Tax=Phaseolus angularis TaxID=3914 RepID=A0A0L9U3R8_PHAAN|nr:hypothetical protein LR48_Vigan03g071300 [Vigna angularis]